MLVHGAWADGYCWSNVILPLKSKGLKVTTAPIPLTTLAEDTATLRRVIEKTTGPVVLVGHAYAGAVIAAVQDDRVKSLVYIAALAPDEGETVADVFYRTAPHPKAPQLAPDAYGLIWMPEDGFNQAVAHKASSDQLTIMAAAAAANLGELHSGEGSRPGVEDKAVVVSSCRRGPHDRPCDPAIHG